MVETLIGRGQVPRASVEQQLFIKLPELNVNINQGRERWRDACRRERLSVLIEMISQERDRKARGGAVENKDDVAKLTALLDALKAGGEEDDKDDVAGNA
ncbi:hypothetical protein BGX23_004937 [Mortierella sp. AD031]|nr:hypothetical protein BGX23_004937 [Mortierella sp. AD031]